MRSSTFLRPKSLQIVNGTTIIGTIPRDSETRPHVQVSYDSTSLEGQANPDDKPIGILGPADDGRPNHVYKIQSLQDAQEIFGGGPLLDAIELAWKSTTEAFSEGGYIYAERVQNATQSTLNAGALHFTSNVYGDLANKVQVNLQRNQIDNTYQVNVLDKYTGYHALYDNLGLLAYIQYQLNDPKNGKASMSIRTNRYGWATKLVINVKDSKYPTTITNETVNNGNGTTTTYEPDGSELIGHGGAHRGISNPVGAKNPEKTHVITFDLTDPKYSNFFALLNAISLLPNMVVDLANNHDISNIRSIFLDGIKDEDITKDINDPAHAASLWSVKGDIVDKLRFDKYVNCTAESNEPLPKPFTYTHLSGGKTSEVPISWTEKLRNFADTPAYDLVVLSADAQIHEELAAYIDDQYNANNNCRGFVGGGFNESLPQLIGRQSDLRDDRICLIGTSGYISMQDGRHLHVPAYMVAADVAGVDSALPVGDSICQKRINIDSTDQNFTSYDLDTLNENGIITIASLRDRGYTSEYRIVDDVTTDNTTNDPVKSELQLGEVTDFLFDDLRIYLSNFLGMQVDSTSASNLTNAVNNWLDEKRADQDYGMVQNFIPDDTYCEIHGESALIYFVVSPVRTLKYINVVGSYADSDEVASGSGNTDYEFYMNGRPIDGNNESNASSGDSDEFPDASSYDDSDEDNEDNGEDSSTTD